MSGKSKLTIEEILKSDRKTINANEESKDVIQNRP